MAQEESNLWVFVDQEILESSTTGERASDDIGGGFGSSKEADSVKTTRIAKRERVPLDAQALKTQLKGLMQVVDDLFEQSEQGKVMCLDEMTISVEVDAEGQVGFAGFGGKLGSTGSITMKFSRHQ